MGYFNAQDGMSVQEFAHRWAINGDKAYDDSMPIKMSIWDVWPYREYDWAKETARAGHGWPYKSPEGDSERENRGYSLGPQKWDNLVQSMKQYGWSPQEPLMLNVGRDGKAMIGEGNHRLAVAMQLMREGEADFSNIPVRVFFVSEIYSDSKRRPKQVVKVESFSFKTWLEADLNEIRTPPHMPYNYYQAKMKKFEELEKRLEGFPQLLEIVPEFLYQFIGSNNLRFLGLPYRIESQIGKSKGGYGNEKISERIRWYLDNPTKNPTDARRDLVRMKPLGQESLKQLVQEFQDHWFDEVKYYRGKLPDIKDEIEEGKDYLKGGSEYDEDDDYPTYEEAKKWIRQLEDGLDAMDEWFKEALDLEKRVDAQIGNFDRNVHNYYHGGEEQFPDHKDTEVLYHATVAGEDILRGGFKTRKDLGGGALGGGPDDVISFTADPEIAKAIAVALVEVIRIAKGRYKFEDIMGMAASHGVDSKLRNSTQFRDYMRWQEAVKSGNYSGSTTEKDLIFNLYRMYLAYASENRVRYDPWFAFVEVSDFAQMDERKVAVLACRVDMRNKERMTWLSSMQELRVPVSAIGSCRKIPFQMNI